MTYTEEADENGYDTDDVDNTNEDRENIYNK